MFRLYNNKMQHPRRPAAVCTHDHSSREYHVAIDTPRRLAERGKNRLPADVHGHAGTNTPFSSCAHFLGNAFWQRIFHQIFICFFTQVRACLNSKVLPRTYFKRVELFVAGSRWANGSGRMHIMSQSLC